MRNASGVVQTVSKSESTTHVAEPRTFIPHPLQIGFLTDVSEAPSTTSARGQGGNRDSAGPRRAGSQRWPGTPERAEGERKGVRRGPGSQPARSIACTRLPGLSSTIAHRHRCDGYSSTMVRLVPIWYLRQSRDQLLSANPLILLVAGEGLEPPTRGL